MFVVTLVWASCLISRTSHPLLAWKVKWPVLFASISCTLLKRETPHSLFFRHCLHSTCPSLPIQVLFFVFPFIPVWWKLCCWSLELLFHFLVNPVEIILREDSWFPVQCKWSPVPWWSCWGPCQVLAVVFFVVTMVSADLAEELVVIHFRSALLFVF